MPCISCEGRAHEHEIPFEGTSNLADRNPVPGGDSVRCLPDVRLGARPGALSPRRPTGLWLSRVARRTGSSLLAQGFAGAKYFHPRPSAAGSGYDAASSGGSNLGPLSKKLIDDTAQRVRDYRAENNLAPDVFDSRRRRERFRQRPRSPHQPGKCPSAGAPRCASTRIERGCRDRQNQGAHGRAHTGHLRRAPGERPSAEPGSGWESRNV